MKVITDCGCIYSVLDYDTDYIASRNGDYNYLRLCNWLQLITLTDYKYPMPGSYGVIQQQDVMDMKNISTEFQPSPVFTRKSEHSVCQQQEKWLDSHRMTQAISHLLLTKWEVT